MDRTRGGLGAATVIAAASACGGSSPLTVAAAPSPTPVPAPAPPVAAPLAPPVTSAYVTVHGLKMHYLRQGERQGDPRPVVVLLHAGGQSASSSWTFALPLFAEHFDVIAPDQLGQGGTHDDPQHPMTYRAMAEDTAALLEQLGVTKAAFVGWSDGGIVALDLAMHHPSLVTKLVTSGANYNTRGLDDEMWKRVLATHPLEEELKPMRESYAKESPDGADHFDVMFKRLNKLWSTEPNWKTKELATIHAPALIIAGDRDVIRTMHTVEIYKAIPGAELAILPNAGHAVPVKDPERWNALVLGFLKSDPSKEPAAY